MAVIVDPDNLDRFQVIFGTLNRKISLFPVGDLINVSSTGSNGATTISTVNFSSSGATFQTWGVAPGDILCLFTGADAGHYTIATVPSETSLTLEVTDDFSGFEESGTDIVFDVRDPSGGSIEDGVTEQAVYSYSKEEWKTDSALYGSDDLIRHPFPFEPITSEQFEIGGGVAHDEWDWFDEYTKKKVRTGGWAAKNTGGTTQQEYAGIVTLGNLDSDSQVYYQQNDEQETPVDFTFLGAVNEAIKIYDIIGPFDRRNYLKLFVRKKGRTYAGSQISDIGVSTIQTIVNRFPLAHTPDAAISATDAEILGTSTFRGQSTLTSASDGSKSASGITFTSATSTFQTDGVDVGDTLRITSGAEQGYYTIESVDSETQLTISSDAEFTSWGSTESSLSFTVSSTFILRDVTDGALANVSGVTGTLTSASSNFTTSGVTAGDMVIIKEAASALRGVYVVLSVDSTTQLTLDTTDRQFTTVSSIDFDVVNPGMYLQYKEDEIIIGATGNITFTDNSPSADTIARASGSWVTDGVTEGSVVSFTGTDFNNRSFTVASVTALTLTLVPSDSVVNETATSATVTSFDGFKREINGIVYSFNWRVFGINASLANIYQFIQHQLRQSSDIDYGPGNSRGDTTDLLISYASPTGTTFNLIIDDINADDTNNATYIDATGASRVFPFVSSGIINFNVNLQNDAAAEYTMFFANDDAGDNTGRDFGTKDAIIINDADNNPIAGNISGQPSISFTYDYDGNTQRGGASAGTNVPVVIVAIGLNTAQYVITSGTITRAKGISFSLVSALERTYSNPI